MAKAGGGPQKSQLHFEQVPLEVVKEIAEIDDVEEKTSGSAASVEPPSERKGKSGRAAARPPARKRR